MQYLVLTLCCILSTTKASIQGAFSRKYIKTLPDTVLFTALFFVFSALLFSPYLIGSPWQIWPFGLMFGCLSIIFQLSYTKALALGNVSLTITLANLSMVIPILFSAFVYNEWPTAFQYVGIALTVLAFAVNTDFKSGKGGKLWFLLTAAAMLSGGLANCIPKTFSRMPYADAKQAYICSGYVVAAVLTFIIHLIISRRKQKISYPIRPRVLLYALGVGVSLAVFQLIYNFAIANYSPAFVFPTYAGGTVIVSSLVGVIFFKDKLSRKQTLSILLGLVAVVLMNF